MKYTFYKKFCFLVALMLLNSCRESNRTKMEEGISNSVVTVSAMKNVMWKGELEGKVKLDTIVPRKGLYGIGPLAFLKGEILVNDGLTYVSKVVSPNEMKVDVLPEAQAPFFVYGHVTSWREQKLPKSVIDMLSLEKALNDLFKDINEPLIFKLKGRVKSAEIHIQNLPDNTKVSSPKEAHQGQVNYSLEDEIVEMIGFYSRAHHGVFTHHDSNMHIHLMTQDKQKMGHLDGLEIGKMKLYLPKK